MLDPAGGPRPRSLYLGQAIRNVCVNPSHRRASRLGWALSFYSPGSGPAHRLPAPSDRSARAFRLGKSSLARALRARMGRGTAWVEQDHVRRIVLRERDEPGAANIDLISISVRFALQRGFNVVLEGILRADHYAAMLEDLHRDYPGASAWYYFDISFAETVRRHATRPQATDFSTEDMRGWYRPNDLLSFVDETIIGENSPLIDTVDRIYREAITHAGDIPACTASDHTHTTAGTHIDERVQ